MSESNIEGKQSAFDPADITALSHLYRGELYRSTVWRTRLDATTNWAVLTTGIALSLTYSSETASPLPLVLVGLLVPPSYSSRRGVTVSLIFGACARMSSKSNSSGQFSVARAFRSRMAGTRFSTRITEPLTFTLPMLRQWAAGFAITTAGNRFNWRQCFGSRC